jgi:uncharacterized protein YhaN
VRICKLELAAFGPFSNFKLDFGSPRPDLHVVFGANEAGKSTALRAVRGLLFGIPERSEDAHRHPAAELLVGAELAADDGRVISVRRRRLRRGSLRDAADAPLDESVMAELLGGMDESGFSGLFGFDHVDLARAAEDMLSGKGELGELLFEAGAGGLGIGRLLKELAAEEEQIFTQKGRTRRLNLLLSEASELRKKLRDARVAPEAHARQVEALVESERRVEQLREQRQALQSELTRLLRIERALSPLGQRRRVLAALASLQHVPVLPEDVPARRRSAEKEREEAGHELRILSPELERARERLAALGREPAIAHLDPARARELGEQALSARQRRRELSSKAEELSGLEQELGRDFQRLGLGSSLEEAGKCVLRSADLLRARRLLEQHPAVRAKKLGLEQRRNDALRHRAELERQLAESAGAPDLDRFDLALGSADRALELARRAAALLERADEHERDLLRVTERLMPRAPAEPVVLRVPSDETLERFVRRFAALELESTRLGRALEQAQARKRSAEKAVERITFQGKVPTEAELDGTRSERDQRLKQLELAGAADERERLAVELRALLTKSDELADRLRREASRVAELAQASFELSSAEAETRALAQASEQQRRERAELDAEYTAAFRASGVEPLTAEEMRPFLVQQRERVRLFDAGRQARESAAAVQRELAAELERLAEAAGEPAEPARLGELRRRVERRAQDARARAQTAEHAQKGLAVSVASISAIEDDLALAGRELEDTERELGLVTRALGLDPQLLPEELSPLLDQLARFAERLELWPNLRAQVLSARADLENFEQQVAQLIARFQPELAALPTEEAAAALLEAHERAVEWRRERERLEQQVADLESRLGAARARNQSALATLAELAERAGLSNADELSAWETNAETARRLRGELAQREAELAEIAAGRTLDELLAEVSAVVPDAVPSRKAELEEELASNEQDLYDARRIVENQQAGLEQLGVSAAPELSQRLAEKAAEIRAGALEYARLRLSRVILEREIASYRDRHQAPILQRAGELFSRLSLGGFHKLVVGAEERVLECVPAQGAPVGVEGLSEGTRYQLYFALRVASLERYLERGSSLPVVLDDIFIHSDDERARAGLEVLAELAERTQVLFFTHHSRLSELAASLGAGRATCHELPRGARQPSGPRPAPSSEEPSGAWPAASSCDKLELT